MQLSFAFLTTILLPYFSNGDTMCGTRTPEVKELNDALKLVEKWKANGGELRTKNQVITINTVWHTIQSGSQGNTDIDVENSIKVLNEAFGPDFKFNLRRTKVSTNSAYWGISYSNDRGMKNDLHMGDCTTLNIYSTALKDGLLGWATFPNDCADNTKLDGVVINYATVPGGSASPYNGGDTLTHEVGHWLMLYHTFQGGCYGSGDGVDDTPAVSSPNFDCPIGTDSCSGGGKDLIENYMDYTEDACMDSFTSGQITRMKAAWNDIRYTESKYCLKYGDSIFLQINNMDRRWLTGGHDDDQDEVETHNYTRGKYFKYKWFIRNIDDSNPQTGTCVKYNDKVYLENRSNSKWLRGGLYDNKTGVEIGDRSINQLTYQWTVQSAPKETTLNVNYGDRVLFQINNSNERWLSGGRPLNGKRGRKVVTADKVNDNKPARYQWTVRSKLGDGKRNYKDPLAP